MRYILFLILALSGCTTLGYHVAVDEDEFTSVTRTQMVNNTTASGILNQPLHLNLQKVESKYGVRYMFKVIYNGDDWIFIRNNNSLMFSCGEQVIRFSATNTSREVNPTASVVEQAWYPVTPEQLPPIFESGSCRVRLVGDRYYVERQMIGENLIRFREFYSNYMNE